MGASPASWQAGLGPRAQAAPRRGARCEVLGGPRRVQLLGDEEREAERALVREHRSDEGLPEGGEQRSRPEVTQGAKRRVHDVDEPFSAQ